MPCGENLFQSIIIVGLIVLVQYLRHIGLLLHFRHLAAVIRLVVLAALIKLILQPLLVFWPTSWLNIPHLWQKVLVL